MTARQKIIPYFLPMQGCSGACVFCDQRTISGRQQPPPPQLISDELAALPPDPQRQLAFYGGSFTRLPRTTQQRYLESAASALREGRIGSIRISTRPDAVDADTCSFLRSYGVAAIELGIQSFSAAVLTASGREYAPAAAVTACRTVAQSGLALGVQLMTGLPADTPQQARGSMHQALELGARELRIYPTLVLRGTELEAMYRRGAYRPQTLTEAVTLAADMYEMAERCGAVLLRVGLNPSPELEAGLVDGPYHPAFGALVREESTARQLSALLRSAHCANGNTDGNGNGGNVELHCNPRDIAVICGQKGQRRRELSAACPAAVLLADAGLASGDLLLRVGGHDTCLSRADYLRQNSSPK